MQDAHPLRVLIVEDEFLLAAEIEQLLTEAGHIIVGHAMSSREAIKLARQLKPDLSLVDIHLDDGPTGIDVAREVSGEGKGFVLFMTANSKRIPEDYAGACGVIGKPYSEHGLMKAVKFLGSCIKKGRAVAQPPASITLSPVYKSRWQQELGNQI